MKTLELTDDLKTGIDDIDDQHRELFKWANEIFSDEVMSDDKKLHEALDNLEDYVNYHFRAEEYAMGKYDYDRLEKHRAQHLRLMKEVTDLFNRSKREGTSSGLKVEMQYMFEDWYRLHIKEWDKPFAAFMKSKNVSAVPLDI
jgi:hemerythrin-like metal-binding protein